MIHSSLISPVLLAKISNRTISATVKISTMRVLTHVLAIEDGVQLNQCTPATLTWARSVAGVPDLEPEPVSVTDAWAWLGLPSCGAPRVYDHYCFLWWFFYWSAIKLTKWQTFGKFWHLNFFDGFNFVIWHFIFYGGPVKKNHPVCSLTLGYWVFQSKVLLCGCLGHSLNCLLGIGFGGSVYHLGVCYTFTD